MNAAYTPVDIPRESVNDDSVFLVEWLVKDGALVKAEQQICVLETSKAAVEYPAPCGGYLHILKEAGQEVPVGQEIACITPTPEKPAGGPVAPAAPVQSPPASVDGPKITAKAQSLLQAHHIDPSVFQGLPLVRERHVLQYLEQHATPAAGEQGLEPHSPLRLRAAKALVASKQTIPHSYLAKHVPSESVERVVQRIGLEQSILVSVSDWVVYCVGQILPRFQKVNTSWREKGLLRHSDIAVGVALNQADGTLVVPVIKDAHTLDVNATAGTIRGFQKRSIRNKLTPGDMTGGHFTVTSLVGSGIHQVFPIIYPDQAAILAIGDKWGQDPQSWYSLTLAFDHRILNGIEAGEFLQALAAAIQEHGTSLRETQP